ncbi:MAG: hypothetical protein M1833_001348 [Piccolia ochrophora]|nr:MAG: hypothetical protein M1833_001348 [Piccolia ochrophora]
MALPTHMMGVTAQMIAVEKSRGTEQLPLLHYEEAFPWPSFVNARRDKMGRQLPQAIAHRGYKAKYAENTMSAFVGAVEAGAHAIETDVHLSRDGVVVLSHDATLKRCYGRQEKIIDCDWDFLKTLRTLKAPYTPMPRLEDLLNYLASPGVEDIWLLLDIKLDNDADDVIRLVGEAMKRIPPSDRPWNQRILLGCWAAKYLPICRHYLPDVSITHIGYNLCYARQFLSVPNVSFNLLQKVLLGPWGTSFLRDARAAGRPVFVWTVNEEEMMRWSIKKQVDGVITDDIKTFLDVCDGYDDNTADETLSWRPWLSIIWINLMAMIFSVLFRWRYGFFIDQRMQRRSIQVKA